MDFSREFGLAAQVIEKDYVLGWLLAGIFNHPVIREVHHPYSDLPSDGIRIKSYCFEEVFAEKFRALAERERPRDLYDVVHLYRHDELDPDQPLILSTLEKKCAFKQIPVPTMDTFRNRPERDELESEWKNMLAQN
jgi:predicted nucleotidyltransferase component of viral defense system